MKYDSKIYKRRFGRGLGFRVSQLREKEGGRQPSGVTALSKGAQPDGEADFRGSRFRVLEEERLGGGGIEGDGGGYLWRRRDKF